MAKRRLRLAAPRRVAATSGAFELHDSRVERIDIEPTGLCVHFAALYLSDEAQGWYQGAELFLSHSSSLLPKGNR